MAIEINDQFKRALELMEETSNNIFVTGKAGTGKSTLLDYFRNSTKKNVVVLAPTGVAAVNIRGQTIHSFFHFKPDITPDTVQEVKGKARGNIYRKIDAVVIDEVSMVRADLLDCVDKFLRLNGNHPRKPFGGLQMIFFGDLYQLPPVVTGTEREIFRTWYASPYFFDAKAFESFEMSFIELEKIYRQKDQHFIDILNAIRNNSATERELAALNERYMAEIPDDVGASSIYLTTTNDLVAEINNDQLTKLSGRTFRYRGAVSGDFEERAIPADVDLHLKIGAQVMLLNNDTSGRWINGSIGKVVEIDPGEDKEPDVIYVKLEGDEVVEVLPYQWDIFRFKWNDESSSLESEVVGSFTQYPIKLAWAVTIHKSQGKTFDRVVLDIHRGTFAPGQLYVAISRCTSLEGLVLKRPILKRHILMDWRVVKFVTKFQYRLSEEKCPLDKKISTIQSAIDRRRELNILYLKSSDVKSRRVVSPTYVGEMEYLGKPFLGMEGFDSMRRETRVFRVDRILEIVENE